MWLLLSCAREEGPQTGFWDQPLPNLVGARWFGALDAAGEVLNVTCRSEDPPEEHSATAPVPGEAVLLAGLLADTTYDCELAAGGQRGTTTFHTGPLPDWLPSWQVSGGTADPGYVVLNHGLDTDQPHREPKILIVDRQGRLRWYHQVPYDASDLDVQYLGDGEILYGGGYVVPPTVVGLDGVVRRVAIPPSTGEVYHHHVEQLENGEVVTLATAPNGVDGEVWVGFTIEILDPTLQERLWVWNSQRGIGEGWLGSPTGEELDIYHANAVIVQGDDVYVNLRHVSQIVALSRATGERRWTLGPGDDFELVDANGDPADWSQWFFGAHAPELQPDLPPGSAPGERRFLLHDNGVFRPGGSYSRAVELAIDEEARTATVTWEWTEPEWFEPIWGDVDRLPNGQVLILRGHCEHCTPTEENEEFTEVMQVDPPTGEVVWRLTFTDPLDGSYRASGIDPCTIFSNRTLCPTVTGGDAETGQ